MVESHYQWKIRIHYIRKSSVFGSSHGSPFFTSNRWERYHEFHTLVSEKAFRRKKRLWNLRGVSCRKLRCSSTTCQKKKESIWSAWNRHQKEYYSQASAWRPDHQNHQTCNSKHQNTGSIYRLERHKIRSENQTSNSFADYQVPYSEWRNCRISRLNLWRILYTCEQIYLAMG